MKNQAIALETARLQDVKTIEDYPDFHERHRVVPAIFEDRGHKRILDIAAGVGCAAARIQQQYPAELLCNDITPTCLAILSQQGLATTSFDLDIEDRPYPFTDGHFDAIVSFANIEHLTHIDHYVREMYRILSADGYLYLTAPNYAALAYAPRFFLTGRSFHDPLSEDSRQKYEFYGHIRYFTYRTLLEYVSSFGFIPDTVYLAKPDSSTRYRALLARSKTKALVFRLGMTTMYRLFSPRWASEPIICFRKPGSAVTRKFRKVVL